MTTTAHTPAEMNGRQRLVVFLLLGAGFNVHDTIKGEKS